MDDLERWCRVTVFGPDGGVLSDQVLQGRGAPDLGAVDEIARQTLRATRIEGRIAISDVSPEMEELLELAGLGVEVKRQAELGEESLGIQERQEETHLRDLPP